MTSTNTPFWTSMLRVARISSPPSKKGSKKSSSPATSSPVISVATKSVATTGSNPPSVSEPVPVLKSSPVLIPVKAQWTSVNEGVKGHSEVGLDAPSSSSDGSAKTQLSPVGEGSQSLCVHPAVSKVLAFEMEGDLSSFKRAGSLGSDDTMGSSSSDYLSLRRSSPCASPNSRRCSSADPTSRRRVSFAQSPNLIVQFDGQQPATKCLDKTVSEIEPIEEEEEDLVDLSSAIAPAADDDWLQNLQREEEDAKVAARIRAKQLKQLEKARALAQRQQQAQKQQQQQKSRRSSWANAISASALSMGSGMGGVVL